MGMSVLGPWVGKIQVYSFHLTPGKNLCDFLRIHTNELQVGQFLLFHLLNGSQQHAGIFFNPYLQGKIKKNHIAITGNNKGKEEKRT
mgnify:CR=1 FL=1